MKLVKENYVFESLQGEGPLTGTPTIFIRTFGCNLKCSWCDTKESWEDESNSVDISIHKLLDIVNEFPQKDVCITGGEPLVQAEDVSLLAKVLIENGKFVSLETNASIYYPIPYINLYSFSPKFGSWDNTILSRFIDYCIVSNSMYHIKVVCDSIIDIRTAKEKLSNVEDRLYIQPLWDCKHYKELIDYCIKNNINVSTQIHKYLGVL